MTVSLDAIVVEGPSANTPPGSGTRTDPGGGSRPGPFDEPGRTSSSWSAAERVHLFVLAVATSCVIGFRLNRPDRLYFDEKHYVPDAQEIWDRGSEIERLAHPPWGKILFGVGIEIFGDNPIGWRIVPAICGVVAVVFSYLAGRAISGRHGIGLLVGLLVMLDGLIIVMSRIAMLDIVAAAHIIVAYVLVLEDRRHRDESTSATRRTPVLPQPIVRHARVLAAMVLGAAVATKWSALPALVTIGLLVLLWDARRRRDALQPRRARPAASWIGRWTATFVLVPAVVYIASHAAWIANYDGTQTAAERCTTQPCDSGVVEVAQGFIREQTAKIEFQRRLIISHPYRSDATGWPVLSRPVLMFAETCAAPAPVECEVAPDHQARILGLGNPVVWWSAIPAAALIVIQAIRRRHPPAASALVLGLALWLPWVISPNPGFLFYMAPVVPFMAIMVGVGIGSIGRQRLRQVVMWGVVGAALGGFVFLYPVWTGLPVSDSGINARLVFDSWR